MRARPIVVVFQRYEGASITPNKQYLYGTRNILYHCRRCEDGAAAAAAASLAARRQQSNCCRVMDRRRGCPHVTTSIPASFRPSIAVSRAPRMPRDAVPRRRPGRTTCPKSGDSTGSRGFSSISSTDIVVAA